MLCPVNFELFYVMVQPSLLLSLHRNCACEFMQFILPEKFVVPHKFRFSGVLQSFLPCF